MQQQTQQNDPTDLFKHWHRAAKETKHHSGSFRFLTVCKTLGLDPTSIHPFIFSSFVDKNSDKDIEALDPDIVLATPFEQIHIEMEKGHLTAPRHDDEDRIYITSMLVKELAPNNFELTVLFNVYHQGRHAEEIKLFRRGDEGYDAIRGVLQRFLERLQSNRFGHINTGEGMRYKSGDGRKQSYKANNIVYVYPKSNKTGRTGAGQRIRRIDAWFVRGHWRKLTNPESLGVNRLGERVVKGHTWISAHQKGEGKAVIKTHKIR